MTPPPLTPVPRPRYALSCAFAVLLAVAAAAWGRQDVGILPGCLATFLGSSFSENSPTWNGSTWVYSWAWSIDWNCNGSAGGTTYCEMCLNIELDYWGTKANSWIEIGDNTLSTGIGGCATETTSYYTTTTTAALNAGTTYRMEWSAARYIPFPGLPPCSKRVESFEVLHSVTWVCPTKP
jgi:hypothetical protein